MSEAGEVIEIPECCEKCKYFEDCLNGKRKVCVFREHIKIQLLASPQEKE